ncbi:MAG: DNA repair protein RadC [bacterium]|nr:MAG: DNA repair protein RadC [bacterium]
MKAGYHARETEIVLLQPLVGRRAAEELLARYPLSQVLRADRSTLMEICQVGPKRAAAILSLPRLLEHLGKGSEGGPSISCSRDVFELFRYRPGMCDQEQFVVLALNSRNRILVEHTAAIGSVNTVHVHPSEILRPAVRYSAASIICLHNHPSGDPVPSYEDRSLTGRISSACALMGFRFLDHLILTPDSYYSFSDSGNL